MAIKALFILLAFCAYQGHGLKEVRLEDVDINIFEHDFMGPVLTLLPSSDDKITACHLTYPNGKTFEAFPQNNLRDSDLTFNFINEPVICSFSFIFASPKFSGTYELASTVNVNNDVTITKQRFNVRITEY